MECNCFEKILGIGDAERVSYQEVINKSAAIKNKLIQKRVRNLQPILESALQARQGLLWKLFHTKTDLIRKPDMEHSCQLFMRHRDVLRELFSKPPARIGPIIIPSSPVKRMVANLATQNDDTNGAAQRQLTIAPPTTPPGSPPTDSNNPNSIQPTIEDNDWMIGSTPIHTIDEGENQDLNEKIIECTNEKERVEGPSTPEISSINENMEPIITDILDNSERQNCTPDISRDNQIDTSNVNTTLTSTADTTNDEQVTQDLSTINNTNSTEPENTFRQQVENISKHYYRPKGTTFRVTWAGFDLAPMEEPLSTVLKLGEGALKDYLKRCSKRALTTLLKRHPEIGLVTKKSANNPKK